MRYLACFKEGFLRKYPLDRPVVTIGRSAGNDIVLEDDSVSKRHCRVEAFPDHIRVVDLKSHNGTFVDGSAIQEARLALNNSFAVGETEIYYRQGDGREFRLSPELTGLLSSLPRSRRSPAGSDRETRETETKYQHLLAAIAEDAVFSDDLDAFISAMQAYLPAVLGPASLLFRCDRRLFPLTDPLQLAGLEALRVAGMAGEGVLSVTGRPLRYRFIRSAGCPQEGGLLFVREQPQPLEPGPLADFLKKLMQLMDFKLKIIREIGPDPEPEPSHHAVGGVTLVSRSPAMRKVADMSRRIAARASFVLIMGESGTGKELIARMIHNLSGRRLYVAINCAAIPEHLLESELFGYEAGAFTDARRRKTGRIEEASGGTLVLDEVGDMPPAIQAKLLRVIQEKAVTRLGGNELIPVDLRIIALTNRDLYRLVEEGTFRQDLFFRLRVHELRIPPLRERREDIPVLVNHFARVYAQANRVNPGGFSEAAHDCLVQYPWPGNVRELENEIARIMEILDEGEVIGDHHLLPAIVERCRPSPPPAVAAEPGGIREKLAETERQEIRRLLSQNQGNKLRTARDLRMSYQGFLKKLKRLDIG